MANSVHFGTGRAFATRTDISNPTPTSFGILQEIALNFEGATAELYGNKRFPVDVAPTTIKVGGAGKMGDISAAALADLFFGASVSALSGLQVYYDEAHSVPASSTYVVTVTHTSGGITDLGVFFTATGQQLVRVAPASEATGKYSVDVATGIYTFAAADAAAALLFNYENAVTTLDQMPLANSLMGSGPVFQLFMTNPYKSKELTVKLNACRITKMNFPFKNTGHVIQDFDYVAFTDASDNLGTFSITH